MSDFERDSNRNTALGQFVRATYQIGDYQFLETMDAPGTQRFHIYVGGRSIGIIEHSLDAALIVAIAYRYDGINSQAAHYFARMIGLDRPMKEE